MLSGTRKAMSSSRTSFDDSRRDTSTFPLYHTSRKKPRRWPLVLRFIKGAIHVNIALPVALHAAFAALIVYIDTQRNGHLSLPSSTIPSLSIVVGLMLVFRNQTSYDRFWQGNQYLTTVETNIRNLTRSFLTCSYRANGPANTQSERADTERTVKILLALIYAAKYHLRAEWGATLPALQQLLTSATSADPDDTEAARLRRESLSISNKPEYDELLPEGTKSFEDRGLGLLLQLSVQVEGYIKRGHDRAWFHAPQASQMTAQLNTLVAAYGSMETIHLCPLPVAYLIHMRQVLALFCCLVPFALVGGMRWYCVVMTAIITFFLYGIEAIGAQLEDPFGYDRNDIRMDAITSDLQVETNVLLEEWRRRSSMFPVPDLV